MDALLVAWMPDANPQPHVVFTKMSVNTAQTVVSGMPATLLDTDFSESEVELIVQNDDVFEQYEVPGGFSNGPSDSFIRSSVSLPEPFANSGLRTWRPEIGHAMQALTADDFVHRHEPYIVTIFLVFGAGFPKPTSSNIREPASLGLFRRFSPVLSRIPGDAALFAFLALCNRLFNNHGRGRHRGDGEVAIHCQLDPVRQHHHADVHTIPDLKAGQVVMVVQNIVDAA